MVVVVFVSHMWTPSCLEKKTKRKRKRTSSCSLTGSCPFRIRFGSLVFFFLLSLHIWSQIHRWSHYKMLLNPNLVGSWPESRCRACDTISGKFVKMVVAFYCWNSTFIIIAFIIYINKRKLLRMSELVDCKSRVWISWIFSLKFIFQYINQSLNKLKTHIALTYICTL